MGVGGEEAAFARCLSLSIRYFSVPQRLIQIAFAVRVVAVTVAIPAEGKGGGGTWIVGGSTGCSHLWAIRAESSRSRSRNRVPLAGFGNPKNATQIALFWHDTQAERDRQQRSRGIGRERKIKGERERERARNCHCAGANALDNPLCGGCS